MQALESILKWDWVLIISTLTFIFIISSFCYQNRRQKSHKFILHLIETRFNWPEIEVDFKLENKSINNIQLNEVKLVFSSTSNGKVVPAASMLGNILLLRNNGMLFAGGREIYSARFRAVDPNNMNEDIDKYTLSIYSKHSGMPVSIVGKICRESK